MSLIREAKDFAKSGHMPTLLTSFLYFDFCFAIWVLNGAMALFIAEQFGLTPYQKGIMVAVPVWAGALMRFPLGILSQYIGRKRAALLEMGIILCCLFFGWQFVSSYNHVLGMGVALGVAGASFGVALSLGSGSFPPKYKGLAMGIAGAGNSGTVLALLAAPPMAAVYGWKMVYGFAMIPMALAFILLLIFAKEPSDREAKKPLSDYLKILWNRDAWIFNLIYSVTFGGFIGLSSFLPVFFGDQYGIPKSEVGKYAAVIVIVASILRVVGGWMSDRLGGIRLLYWLCGIILVTVGLAATLPANPLVTVAILVVTFAAMGAGNGAVFQLVPLRFRGDTAVASSLIGEVGALAGGFLPYFMGLGKQGSFTILGRHFEGSFTPGFLSGVALCGLAMAALFLVDRRWTTSWVGAHGKALDTFGEDRRHAVAPDLD